MTQQQQQTASTLDYRSPTTPAPTPMSQKLLGWLNVVGTFAALLLIFGFFSIMSPQSFPTAQNVETLARQTTTVAIGAMGMTLIIVAGGIDLSAGSIVALVVVAIAMALQAGMNPWISAAIGILTGAACGFVNGALITGLRVVPFIITLGMLEALRGLATHLAHEQPIYSKPQGLQKIIAALGPNERWKVFPPGVWIMLIIVALTAVLLRYTRFGRHVVAVGSNEQTARLCGIPVTRVKILVYTLGGLLTGIAGLMQYSRLTIGDPTIAQGLELNIIAAVVIGGGSLNGGEGSALGSLIGAAIMATISAGGSHLGWANSTQRIITGAIIIVAVALDQLRHRTAAAAQGD
jgi:ribose/xylose/arabinose/galactoside ABC-type transport system permease subunit